MKTKQSDAVKIYIRRDSATSVLRKMGINTRDYGLFIERMSDGRFACQVAMAEMHLQQLEQRNAKPEKSERKKAAKPEKAPRETISSLCRNMILDGKSNSEIFTKLQETYGEERFGPEKRHYPAWYRCELRRKGELPPAFDTANQDTNITHILED